MDLPHIKLKSDTKGHVVIEIEDTEVFDYVEDYLLEVCGIEYETVSNKNVEGVEVYSIVIASKYTYEQVAAALEKLSPAEIERIYSINQ